MVHHTSLLWKRKELSKRVEGLIVVAGGVQKELSVRILGVGFKYNVALRLFLAIRFDWFDWTGFDMTWFGMIWFESIGFHPHGLIWFYYSPQFEMEPKNEGFQKNLLFQGAIFRFHV